VAQGDALPRDVAEWEPHEALLAGEDGLSDYRRLAAGLPLLLGDGIACVEIGFDQAAAVTALFEAGGLRAEARCDLAGRPRCLVLSH
jgi:release factor glutamine methyltransferase